MPARSPINRDKELSMDTLVPLIALIALALCAIPFGTDSRPGTSDTFD